MKSRWANAGIEALTISALKRQMNAAIQHIQQHPPMIGNAITMERAAKALEAAGAKASDKGGQDRIRQGLKVLAQGDLAAARHNLRFICWGITEPFPKEPLLCRAEFAVVLDLIRHSVAENEFTLNAWRGLLQGYLTAKPDDIDGTGRNNWLELRDFLASSLAAMFQRTRVTPPWLTILTEHKNLLLDRPCDRYACLLLKGEGEHLDPLKNQLRIPDHSWFWREAVLAQIRSACDLEDQQFHKVLKILLDKLQDYPALANDSLILLLTRYARAFYDIPHEGLQDYAVKYWGSPNIFAQAKWAQVAPEVKAMVQAWLVRDDLSTFFEILQEDRTADRRRFDFWLRYHKQMSFVRIALGSQPWYSNQPDYKNLRERRSDRVCRLDGGQGSTSAIVMKINSYFFVEFSHTGNAAYGYSEHRVEFPLDRKIIQRDTLSNKATAAFRASHSNVKNETWEQKFERILADELGVFPDSDTQPLGTARLYRSKPASSSTNGDSSPKPPFASGQNLDMARLEALCRHSRLSLNDNRSKGGAVWVRHLRASDTTARELQNMGFRFSPGNGWWRK